MTWTAETQTVNQQVQIGPESTPGTAVAASKLLKCYDWVPGINAGTTPYTPSGNKYVASQEEDWEEAGWTIGGILDYNGLPYLLSSAMGKIVPALHSPSITAYDWIYTPPLTGSIQPQTYTVMQGDSIRARKTAYVLVNNFGYKGTRKTPFTISGKAMAQSLQDGIVLTSSPTAVALAQATTNQFNVYLDTTSGGIGTTQLTRVFSIEYAFDNIYGPFYPLNRSNSSFTGHVDLMPKTSFKMLVAADSTGFGAMQGYLESQATVYIRVSAQGALIDAGNSIHNTFQHDMAVKFTKPSDLKDEQGIFATEWECTIVQDPAWASGQAQTITVTNLISAL